LVLGRQVRGVLFRVVCYLFTISVEEADPFNVRGVSCRPKFRVPPELNGRNYIGLPSRPVGVDGDGFAAGIDRLPILSLQHGKYISLEVDMRIGRRFESMLMCFFLILRQPIGIAEKTIIEFNDDVHVTLGIDIRIVTIRALEKNFEVLIGIRRRRGFQHVLDRVVGAARLGD